MEVIILGMLIIGQPPTHVTQQKVLCDIVNGEKDN
jgi:hypothetical protein